MQTRLVKMIKKYREQTAISCYTHRVPNLVMREEVRGAERYIIATFILPTKEITPALDLKAPTRG